MTKELLLPSEIFACTGHEDSYVRWWVENQDPRAQYTVELEGLRLSVRQGVFSPNPALTYSTAATLPFLKEMKDRSFLDIGTGTGVLSLFAAKAGAARVCAIDCDPLCVQNAKENLAQPIKEGKAVVLLGDLFPPTPCAFDVMTANLPLADSAWPHLKEGTRVTFSRLFAQLPSYLAPDGVCHVAFASFGDKEGFKAALAEAPLALKATRTIRKFDVLWHAISLQKRLG